MRKFMILASVVAIVVAALALPALAQDSSPFRGDQDQQNFEQRFDKWQDRAEERNYTDSEAFNFYLERFNHFYGFDGFANDRWNDDDDDDFDKVAAPVVTQESAQEAESGDVNQSFNVSNTGDNSSQCAGVQGVTNTGTAQNQIGVLQYGSSADDFSFEDSGASINVSPVNATSCDQAVNQAATAYGR